MLKGRSFLKLLDYSKDEIRYLLDLAKKLKKDKKSGDEKEYLKKKNIVILFEKTSTRTRCAFEVAAYDQGANITYLDPSGSQMGKKESIKDTARVLGRMYDGIEYRGYGQEKVEELAKYSGVPVWNGLTTEFHPTQVLADLMTIEEHLGKTDGRKMVYFGDARNNMANSLMIGSAIMGMDFVACGPKELHPAEELVKKAIALAEKSGASIKLMEDPVEASKGADIFYTDVWVSMGESKKVWKERIEKLEKYRVTKELMDLGKEDAIFMHCLPAFHDLETTIAKEIEAEFGLGEMEVSNEVFESKKSVVFDEAENRLHTIKAVMVATLGGENI
jgi:ornithine carbamoyltransferase